MQEPAVVFAASSLTNVLQAAAKECERAGLRVLLNVGASNSQARQILEGAPADLFCSADEAQMDAVERAGKIVAGSRVVLAFNHLVVVVPNDRARTLRAIGDLAGDPQVERIAVGDPAAVPAGVYTREYLQRAGLWERVQPKLVPTTNVRAALAAVEAGNADAAFVYATDAPTAPHVRVAFAVPDADSPPIVYPAAIVSSGRNPDGGRKFLAYLEGAAGRAILTRFGFGVPK